MASTFTLTLALGASLTYCNGVALAQKSPKPQGKISVAEILDKHISAMGGTAVLHALQTLHAQGVFGIAPMPPTHALGDFHFYFKAPDSDVFQLETISHGQSSSGRNQGVAFSNRSVMGAQAVNGVTLEALEKSWFILLEWEFDQQHYTRIELVGLAEIEGRWAYALGFTPRLGDRQVRYFDSETFLLLRVDQAQRIRQEKNGPESAYKVETSYFDYRDSEGIKFPRRVEASASNGSVVFDVHQVHPNAPVDEVVFHKN